jgi:hypothetical protein
VAISTGILLPRVKRQGMEIDRSLSSIVEVKNGAAIPTLPHRSLLRFA